MQFQPIDSGLAQSFGPQMPPMAQVLDRYQQQQFVNAQAQAKRQQELSDENRKQLRETLKYAPDLALSQFTDELKTKLSDYQNVAAQVFKDSNVPTPEQEKELAAMKFGIEGNVAKVKEYKQTITDVLKMAEGDKTGELNSELVHEKLYDTLQGASIETLNPDNLRAILNDPMVYSGDAVVSNFAESIPETIETIIEEKGSYDRPFRDTTQVKSKFLKLDGNGDPIIDENGKPVLNVTTDLLQLAKKNQRLAIQIGAEKARLGDGATDLQAFKNIIGTQAYVDEKTTRSNALVKNSDGSGSGSKEELASKRRGWLEDAVGYNGKTPDPSQLGKLQDLGVHSIQYKIGGKYVDRAEMTDISKSFGERTLGKYQQEPTAISVKIQGKDDNRGNPTFKTVEIPIKTSKEKEAAIFKLNNIVDGMVKAGFEVGTEAIDAAEEEIDDIASLYIKEEAPAFPFAREHWNEK